MPVRLVAVAVLVCGFCLLSVPRSTMPVESQETAAQIDFDALHAQATTALETLQHARERRLASAESTSSF
jgi:hypothetical protein